MSPPCVRIQKPEVVTDPATGRVEVRTDRYCAFTGYQHGTLINTLRRRRDEDPLWFDRHHRATTYTARNCKVLPAYWMDWDALMDQRYRFDDTKALHEAVIMAVVEADSEWRRTRGRQAKLDLRPAGEEGVVIFLADANGRPPGPVRVPPAFESEGDLLNRAWEEWLRDHP